MEDMNINNTPENDGSPISEGPIEDPVPEETKNESKKSKNSSNNESELKNPDRFNSAMSAVFDMVEVVALSVSIVYLVFCFFFRVAVVNGPSMNKTLQDKDILIVSELFYKPQRGDVIVCQNEYIGLDEPIVKRVIAVAGDTINIDFDNWQVYINGQPIEEDYVNYIKGAPMRHLSFERYGGEYVIPEGHVFVMGDNRNNSNDSRSYQVGPIDERLIIGRVVFRLWPLSSIGIID